MSTSLEHGRAVQFWVHIPIPRVATEPYPPPDFLAANYYPLSTAVGRSGRSGPPLCGGTPPATPPCSYAAVLTLPQLVCQRPGDNATVPARNQPVCQSQRGYATVPAQFQLVANAPRTRRQRACAAPAVRITNHKSRVTAVLDGRAVPALPCAGGLPPQRPPAAMPPCLRFPSSSVSDRETMPPCLRGTSRCVKASEGMPPCLRNSSLSPTRRGRDASARARLPQFESQITNHESRPFWTVGPFRPSLVRGDAPRNAPL